MTNKNQKKGGKPTTPVKSNNNIEIEGSKDNTIRVSNSHSANFYIKAATNFLHGVTGKDGIEKKIFDEIIVSALGVAISTVAQVAATLEERGIATILKTETAFVTLEYGRMPHIQCTLKRNPAYVPPPKPESSSKDESARAQYADGPATPARLLDEKMEKKMKKVIKEGGKRGVEIEGAHDMGGTKFFPTKVLEPEDDIDMLIECVKAMNAKCAPDEEERKGGSNMVGKLIMSLPKKEENKLAVCCYVPPSFTNFSAQTWLEELLKKLDIPSDNTGDFKWHVANPVYSAILVNNNPDKNVFCVKIRDYVIQRSNDILIAKELIPPFDDDSDSDVIYGDDDLCGY